MALCVAASLCSCEDRMAEHYAEPDYLQGSISEVLAADGRHTLFLQGVELCDWRRILDGKSILTVMAPDDDAMRAYLTAHYGTDDLTAIDRSEVRKLIGFHILYYPFRKEMLQNFRPKEGDGATEEQKATNAGLYYKFRTRSQDAPTKVQPARLWDDVNGMAVDTSGVTVDVYHLERFVPLFSSYMFQTKRIDAKRNYEYFYPATQWSADDGFHVSDASVTEYERIAKNGYIYYVDRVVTPLETIHHELEADERYSRYLSLYDQYDYYAVEPTLTNTYGGGTVTYYKRGYNGGAFTLPDIDSEWPVSDYSQMEALSGTAVSVFAPTDAAFDEFYRSYWGDEGTGYPSEVCYDSISSDAIGYLLSNSFYSSSIVFPEEIERGDVVNRYTKTVIRFDPDAVPQQGRRMCVNGVLYGQDLLTPPAVFGSVTGPAYKYKRYALFLKMLTTSSMLSTLTTDAVRFLMLYPSDDQFAAGEIWYDAATDKIKNGPVGSTTAGNLGSGDQSKYVNAHIVSLADGDEGLATGPGVSVYRTLSTDYKLYWYVKDGRITNSLQYASLIHYNGNNDVTAADLFVPFEELTFRGDAWSNGHAYAYDPVAARTLLPASTSRAIYPSFVPMMYAHRNDQGTLFQGFIQLLLKANMIDEQAQTMNFMTEDCLMLVPTTDAVKAAILAGTMPYVTAPAGLAADDPTFWNQLTVPADGSDEQTDFQHYLLEYFYPESTSPHNDYPYPRWLDAEQGAGQGTLSDLIPSIADISVMPSQNVTVQFFDNTSGADSRYPCGISALMGGNAVPLHDGYDWLPFVFEDGGVQFLDGIFPDVWPKGE